MKSSIKFDGSLGPSVVDEWLLQDWPKAFDDWRGESDYWRKILDSQQKLRSQKKFDLLKLPRELRDMIYLAWLDVRGDDRKVYGQFSDHLHDCRGSYMPFRSYLRESFYNHFRSTMEVKPTPCEFFTMFGSCIRQESMEIISRDSILFDLKAQKCMRTLSMWIQAVPEVFLRRIRRIRVLVNCSISITQPRKTAANSLVSSILQVQQHAADFQTSGFVSNHIPVFEISISSDAKKLTVATPEVLTTQSQAQLALISSFVTTLQPRNVFDGLDLIAVVNAMKWSEAKSRNTEPLAVRHNTHHGDPRLVRWLPWCLEVGGETTRGPRIEGADASAVKQIAKHHRTSEDYPRICLQFSVDDCRAPPWPPSNRIAWERTSRQRYHLIECLLRTAKDWEASFHWRSATRLKSPGQTRTYRYNHLIPHSATWED